MKQVYSNLCYVQIIILLFSPFISEGLNKSDSTVIIKKICITGNKVTKAHIIIRELSIAEGDTLLLSELPEKIEKSKSNLLNTSLFNFVSIEKTTESNNITLLISVTERWYTWPSPFFQLADRNFNTWWETKDFSRVDYGVYLTRENFRGRMENLRAIFIMGYDYTYGFSYKAPYINKKRTIGLGLSAGFSGNHEVAYATVENKQKFYKDKITFVQENRFSSLNLVLRKHIYVTHTFQLNFNSFLFADSLYLNNPDYTSQSKIDYFSLSYYFKNDHRDFKSYPLSGYFLDFEIVRSGLGILKNENADYTYIRNSSRKYFKISDRLFFASGLNLKISSCIRQPYYYMHGLGFGGDYVRGYEYYVIDGQNFGVVKTNAKFAIIPTKEKYLKFIPLKKFNRIHYALYLNLYGDAGYVDRFGANSSDKLSGSLLYGYGIGLDLVTYYDKIIRLDFSFNKKGESGLFLHFVAPI